MGVAMVNRMTPDDGPSAATSHPTGALTALMRGAGGGWLVNVAGLAVAFTIMILLTKTLGAEGYGALHYTLAWAEVLGMLAPLGMDKLVIRELAVYRAASQWSLIRGVLRSGACWTFIGAGIGIAVVVGFAWLMRERLDEAMWPVFWVAAALVPMRALLHWRHGVLVGLNRPVAGLMTTAVNYPLAWLAMIGFWLIVMPSTLTPSVAAIAALVGLFIAVLIAEVQIQPRLDRQAMRAGPVQVNTREWLSAALPMMFIIALALCNLRADVIMLGAIRGSSDAGVYAVAAQFAFLVRLAIVAVNPALAPLAANTNGTRLQSIARSASRLAFGPAVICTLVLLLMGQWVLTWFSIEFADGYAAMCVLAVALLTVTAFGPVETVLLMKGHQRIAAASAAAASIVNIVLNAAFIPQWGMLGAASATAISTIAWALMMTLAVWRRLGFTMTILSPLQQTPE